MSTTELALKPLTTQDWQQVKAQFDQIKKVYEDTQYTPGCNTTLALRVVFGPLEARYNSDERTQELYDEMAAVE